MNQIKQIRMRCGLTVKELAAAMGVHPMSVYRWQSGETVPELEHAWRLIHLARARRVGASLERIYPDPTIGDEA